MNPAGLFPSIVETYEKFGWVLRRAVLTPSLKDRVETELNRSRAGVHISAGDIDGLWFSRPSDTEQTAWELRYLGEMPFSLLVHLSEKDSDFEDQLAETEARLAAAVRRKASA